MTNISSNAHISTCILAEGMPACSLKGHDCSLSCLVLWFDHVDMCDTCLTHLMCCETDAHCLRIAELIKLRDKLRMFLLNNKLTEDGYVFQEIKKSIITLLNNLDFNNISY